MAEETKESPELKCVVCGLSDGQKHRGGNIAEVKFVTVLSKDADEANISPKELALCNICSEMGAQRVLFKCTKCQSAFVAGFERNAAVFETKDGEGNLTYFSFNDNLAKMLDQPVEDIWEKPVLLFICGCSICEPKQGCGGKCGGCGGKCGGGGHDGHKCDGGCGGKCHGSCAHEEDKS